MKFKNGFKDKNYSYLSDFLVRFFFERKGLNFDVFFQSNKRKRERKREKVALLQPQPAIVSNGDSAAAV